MDDVTLEQKISQVIENNILTSDFVLEEIQVRSRRQKKVVAVTLDRVQGGITIDECARWNREIANWIENEELIGGAYLVEVSSPGIDRPLKQDKDFRKILGKSIVVHHKSEDDRTLQHTGILKEIDAKKIYLELKSKKETKEISLESIVLAKQVINF